MKKISIVRTTTGKGYPKGGFWPEGWVMSALHVIPVKEDRLAYELVEQAINCENKLDRSNQNLNDQEKKHMEKAKEVAARLGYELEFEKEVISYDELEKRIKANL